MSRRRRATIVLGTASALLASAGLWGATMLRADATHHRGELGPLTSRQYDAAVRAAQHQVDSNRAHLTRAVAVVRDGKVRDNNAGKPCTSGKLVKIQLVGRFPRVTVSPPPGGSSRATSMVVEIDASSGTPCLVGVSTGKPKAYQDTADLMPALSGR